MNRLLLTVLVASATALAQELPRRTPLRASPDAPRAERTDPADDLISSSGLEKVDTLNGIERFRYGHGVPYGFHVVESYFAAHAGIVVFGSSWLPLVVAAAIVQEPALMIPLAGPFLGFFSRESGYYWAPGFAIAAGMLVAAAQLAGASMLIAGLIAPRRWLQRDGARPSVSFVPSAGGGSGLVVA